MFPMEVPERVIPLASLVHGDWGFLSMILKRLFALVSVARAPCGPKYGNQSMVNMDKLDIYFKNTP